MKRAVSEGRLVKSLFWHLLFPRVVLLFCSQSPISTLWKYVFVPWVCKAWYLKLMPFLPRCKNLDYLPPLRSLPWPLSCSLFPWLISCLKTVGDYHQNQYWGFSPCEINGNVMVTATQCVHRLCGAHSLHVGMSVFQADSSILLLSGWQSPPCILPSLSFN